MPAQVTPNRYYLLINAFVVFLTLITAANRGIAQKLPGKQTVSLRSAVNMKIDGKLPDDFKFQAYNKATETWYTLSNDDVNLYLTVRSGHRAIASRIINGGLTLTIKSTDKRAAESVAVTYPVFDSKNRMNFTGTTFKDGHITSPDGKEADSLAKASNANMAKKAKSIRVAGIPTVDTLISVYNDDGIKAVGAFDAKLNYNYELVIPLKYLSSLLNSDKQIAYQVKINAADEKGITTVKDDNGRVTFVSVKLNSAVKAQEATDFWAEYTLAQKP